MEYTGLEVFPDLDIVSVLEYIDSTDVPDGVTDQGMPGSVPDRITCSLERNLNCRSRP